MANLSKYLQSSTTLRESSTRSLNLLFLFLLLLLLLNRMRSVRTSNDYTEYELHTHRKYSRGRLNGVFNSILVVCVQI